MTEGKRSYRIGHFDSYKKSDVILWVGRGEKSIGLDWQAGGDFHGESSLLLLLYRQSKEGQTSERTNERELARQLSTHATYFGLGLGLWHFIVFYHLLSLSPFVMTSMLSAFA